MRKNNDIFTPANIVTLARICLIPVFVAVALAPWPSLTGEMSSWWTSAQPIISAAIFALISLTDSIDGYLARSRQEVTDFGKFLDPLADKILVAAALLVLVESQTLPSWIALIILAREFIVSGVRMMAASKGVVIAASILGKIKTILQIFAVIVFLLKGADFFTSLSSAYTIINAICWVIMVAAVVMTLASMADYLSKSREILGFAPKSSKEN